MKTLNSIVKAIAALAIIGALFVTCSINNADEYGTLVIKLPGSNSARTVSDYTKLNYHIKCSSDTEEDVTSDAVSGDSISIRLSPGHWDITLTVLDDEREKEIGRGTATADIESGETKTVSIHIEVDEYPYLGETLNFSGQVYGGASQDYNQNNPYTHNADVYAEYDIGGNGSIKTGKLEFTINTPKITQQLFSGSMYDNLKFNPSDVQGAPLSLRAISQEGNHNNYALTRTRTNGNTTESVNYLYVDRDVTVTAQGTTSDYEDQGQTITRITSNINLNLKKGWNTVYSKEETIGNTRTFSLSLRNYALKWVLVFIGPH